MKNLITTCLLLLAFSSCKKSTDSIDTPEIQPIPKTSNVDMSAPFSSLNFSNYTKQIDYQFETQSELAFIGYLGASADVKSKTINPFIGATLKDISYNMVDVEGISIATSPKMELVFSQFRQSYSNLLSGRPPLVVKPRITYEIYANEDIKNTSTTNVTLIIKANYFNINLPTVSADNIKFYTTAAEKSINEVAYVSKIGYGMMGRYALTSPTAPKKYLPYLKAFMDDLINNGGKNSTELMKELDSQSFSRTTIGGTRTPGFPLPGEINQTIKDLVTSFSLPREITELACISYEFRSLKDNSVVN